MADVEKENYKIQPSERSDLGFIFSLFESAVQYQKQNGFNLWPQFSRELIETEIREGRNWKIVSENEIACVFSVLYNDPVIWKERNAEPAVYLHRIAINPEFKGRKMMHVVKDWAIAHARENGKKFVRMDTWGDNEKLRRYYIACGFEYLGQQHLDKPEEHYGGSVLSLFQIEVW